MATRPRITPFDESASAERKNQSLQNVFGATSQVGSAISQTGQAMNTIENQKNKQVLAQGAADRAATSSEEVSAQRAVDLKSSELAWESSRELYQEGKAGKGRLKNAKEELYGNVLKMYPNIAASDEKKQSWRTLVNSIQSVQDFRDIQGRTSRLALQIEKSKTNLGDKYGAELDKITPTQGKGDVSLFSKNDMSDAYFKDLDKNYNDYENVIYLRQLRPAVSKYIKQKEASGQLKTTSYQQANADLLGQDWETTTLHKNVEAELRNAFEDQTKIDASQFRQQKGKTSDISKAVEWATSQKNTAVDDVQSALSKGNIGLAVNRMIDAKAYGETAINESLSEINKAKVFKAVRNDEQLQKKAVSELAVFRLGDGYDDPTAIDAWLKENKLTTIIPNAEAMYQIIDRNEREEAKKSLFKSFVGLFTGDEPETPPGRGPGSAAPAPAQQAPDVDPLDKFGGGSPNPRTLGR